MLSVVGHVQPRYSHRPSQNTANIRTKREPSHVMLGCTVTDGHIGKMETTETDPALVSTSGEGGRHRGAG